MADPMKSCSICKIQKTEEFFSFKHKQKGIKQPFCRDCNREYMRAWYRANKHRTAEGNNARHKIWSKLKKKELTDSVYLIKSEPCMDCATIFKPWQMQFDHRVPSEKSFNIATMVQRRMPLDLILKEIGKCDLVCSNCHAHRTYRRRHQIKGLKTNGDS